MSLASQVSALAARVASEFNTLRSLAAREAYTFSVSGAITGTYTGQHRIYMEFAGVVETVRAALGTPSSSGTFIVDVNKNGTTIYTTQSARPTIAASANSANGNNPAVTAFAAGDYLTVDVDSFGASAANLTVCVRVRRTA